MKFTERLHLIVAIVLYRIRSIILTRPEPIEFIVGFAFITFGIILLLPYESYQSSHAYELLSKILSEQEAGLLGISIGALVWLILLFGNIYIRRLSMLLSALIWAMLTTTLVASSPTTAGVDYVWALGALWAYLRLLLVK